MNTTLHLMDFVVLGGMYAIYNMLDRAYGQWHSRRENARHLAKAAAIQRQITADALEQQARDNEAAREKALKVADAQYQAFLDDVKGKLQS